MALSKAFIGDLGSVVKSLGGALVHVRHPVHIRQYMVFYMIITILTLVLRSFLIKMSLFFH